ncbi:MAG: hypothetical protein J3K34DRAFT_473059 [Monoraphidium minutum]|nr:MAG: hypothetical protein J3K34DRAFT_473059 [Monoraphidium minutum]
MAASRIDVLAKQLTASSVGAPSGPASMDLTGVCPEKLGAYLCHDNPELRRAIFEFLKDPLYRPDLYLSMMEFREQTLVRLQKFLQQRFFSIRDYLSGAR